jgi:hypothetical protein
VNPQEKQADDGPLADQLSISVLLRIAGSNHGFSASCGAQGSLIEERIAKPSVFNRNRNNRDQPCPMAGLLLCIVEREGFAGRYNSRLLFSSVMTILAAR